MREKKRPTAMELIKGAPGFHTKAAVKEPSQQGKTPYAPPARLNESQAAIWVEVEATVSLSSCDLFMLETLVCLLDQQRILQLSVNQDGPIIKQANGRPMHNPAAMALRHLDPQLTRCFKELGMSPATRKRLKLDCRTDDEYNEWSEF